MTRDKWHVGAAVGVVMLAVLACKGGKSDDSKDAGQPAATASASASAIVDPVPSDQPDTSVAIKPVTKPKAAPTASALPLPGATVDVVNAYGLGTGSGYCPPEWPKCCPPAWIGTEDGQCNRPCKTDGDCHAPDTCKHKGTQAVCAEPVPAPPLPGLALDEDMAYGPASSHGCPPAWWPDCLPPGWTNGCAPGWIATGTGRCKRPCNTDGDCHVLPGGAVGPPNKCKHDGTRMFCDRP